MKPDIAASILALSTAAGHSIVIGNLLSELLWVCVNDTVCHATVK